MHLKVIKSGSQATSFIKPLYGGKKRAKPNQKILNRFEYFRQDPVFCNGPTDIQFEKCSHYDNVGIFSAGFLSFSSLVAAPGGHSTIPNAHQLALLCCMSGFFFLVFLGFVGSFSFIRCVCLSVRRRHDTVNPQVVLDGRCAPSRSRWARSVTCACEPRFSIKPPSEPTTNVWRWSS